ncbi:hypothetical protein GCM10009558_091120 [Virgisporangium aurantiacum]
MQLDGRADPVEPGHLDVDDRHVGADPQRGRHDRVTGLDRTDDLDVLGEAQHADQRVPEHAHVLGK